MRRSACEGVKNAAARHDSITPTPPPSRLAQKLTARLGQVAKTGGGGLVNEIGSKNGVENGRGGPFSELPARWILHFAPPVVARESSEEYRANSERAAGLFPKKGPAACVRVEDASHECNYPRSRAKRNAICRPFGDNLKSFSPALSPDDDQQNFAAAGV